ncbi:MAG: capsule assembly Wzi family protein [Pseudomonadota bacterium]
MRYSKITAMLVCIWMSAYPAKADPWTAVDDRVLRSDIELLADAGLLRGPLASWPINWKQVRGALETADMGTMPRHVRDAFLRVQRVMPPRRGQGRSWGAEIDVAATNRPTLVRSYGAQARGDYDAQARFIGRWGGGTTLSLSLGLQDEPFGRNVTFDNAYLSQEIGNWIGYVGTVERWWSPGWNNALIFSTSARPQPQVGLKRNSPDPFKSKWLSWLGPWSIDMFLALQDDSGGRFDDDLIGGLRVDVQPLPGLTFSVKRAIQLCGEGRPCGFSTWVDSIFPINNADNTGTLDEPGNQMAGFDLRYGGMVGNVAYSVYGEFIGEDETNFFISKFASLWGLRLAGPWGDEGARWEVIGEFSDTQANRAFIKENFRNVIYSNFIYRDGWVYRGRPLGSSLDNDSQLYSLTGNYTDTRNRNYRLAYHYVRLNTDGTGRQSVSVNAESFNIVEAEAIWPTQLGDVRAEVRLQDDRPNSPGQSEFTGAFELSYQIRF